MQSDMRELKVSTNAHITELVNRDKSNQLRIKALETAISELKHNCTAGNSQMESLIHDNQHNKADISSVKHSLVTGQAMDNALKRQMNYLTSNQAITNGFSSRIHNLETHTLWLGSQQQQHSTIMNQFNSTILSLNIQLQNTGIYIIRILRSTEQNIV